MKAAVCQAYGGPEVVDMVDRPDLTPGKGEVLVRVLASTVNSADSRIRSLNVPKGFGLPVRLMFGWSRPKKVLGAELAGEVVEIGEGVTDFAVGDQVFADCGMKMGAHATHRLFSVNDPVIKVPDNVTIEEAAAICFGGSTALYFLRQKAQLQAGEKVLINGASGTVGSAAIQIAKILGATVTAVCRNENRALVTSLGADSVVDYQSEEVLPEGVVYDVIMDNVGSLSWSQSTPHLAPKGRFVGVVADLYDNLSAPLRSLRHSQRYIAGTVVADTAMLRELRAWVESGHYRPVIAQTFPMAEIQAAYRLVDSGRKKGSVVLIWDDEA